MGLPRLVVRAGKGLAAVAAVIGVVLLPLNAWQAADFASKKGWLWRSIGHGGRVVLGPVLRKGTALPAFLVVAGAVVFGSLIVLDRRWRKAEATQDSVRASAPVPGEEWRRRIHPGPPYFYESVPEDMARGGWQPGCDWAPEIGPSVILHL